MQPAAETPRPAFSIVIPTLDRPEALRRCLESIAELEEPLGGFEVVVVDDGGMADLEPVLTAFRDKFALRLLRQPNAGPAAARNAGAAVARGDFLAFTDDDCRPSSGWLRALQARFAADASCAVTGRKSNLLHDNLYSCASQAINDVLYSRFNARNGQAGFVSTSNLAVPASGFRETDGFDAAFRTSEDREFGDRWRARGLRMVFAPEAVVFHAHPLTLGGLWRQHYEFGRGAFRFHRKRQALGGKGLRPDLRFYWRLLWHPFEAKSFPASIALFACILWAEAANACGYWREWLASARRKSLT